MKNFKNRSLQILIILNIQFSSLSFALDNSTINFFPVENLKIITPYSCEIGQEIVWVEKYQTTLNGIKPKTKLSTYSHLGNKVEATVGNPVCFNGECGANFIALPLKSYMPLNEVIAVSKNKEIKIVKLALEKEFHLCKNVTQPEKDPGNFGHEALPPRCKYFSWKTHNTIKKGELVSFGWMQGNGWNIYQQHFRLITKDNDKTIKYGDLQQLIYSTNEFKPYFGFYTKDKTFKLLWGEFNGIGPVSAITFRESHITKDGKLFWDSEYKAGGQPCD